jgi:hypothetical protein
MLVCSMVASPVSSDTSTQPMHGRSWMAFMTLRRQSSDCMPVILRVVVGMACSGHEGSPIIPETVIARVRRA